MRRTAVALGVALGLLSAGSAAATHSGWTHTGFTPIPIEYYQGVTNDPLGNWYFDGIYTGLYRTDPALRRETGRNPNVIPPAVLRDEGYNHIGDISYDAREGGRILLPLECYYPVAPEPNTCQTGSIGVADARTLQWKYYVKLDPAEIPKAMWVEISPDGELLWTSSGNDFLAYRADDVRFANRVGAPGAQPIKAVKRLTNVKPPAGPSGAVFYEGRLYTAGQSGDNFRVWSSNVEGNESQIDQRLEIQRTIIGESEGLAVNPRCGGLLHWMVMPFNLPPRPPTYGPNRGALLHFVPSGQAARPPACGPLSTGGGSPTGPPQGGGDPPPASRPSGSRVSLRLGGTSGMRRARRGRPFRIRARAVGSRLRGVRISVYSMSGRRIGGSRVFYMPRGRLLRPRVWVKRRLPRGSYAVVARARMPSGRRLGGSRHGIEINRR